MLTIRDNRKKKGGQRRALTRKQRAYAAVDAATRAIPRGTFAAMGGAAGGALYGAPGAAVGNLLGRGLAKITGRGDYKVRTNSIMTVGTAVDEVPTFTNTGHSVRVRHREFVRDFLVPDDPDEYHNVAARLNPGNADLFPWLNRLAKQYQMYKPHGMVVEFVSRCSDYAANGPLGTIGIATNYNATDLPYGTHQQFENSEFAVSCKPSLSVLHAIECAPGHGKDEFRFVRDPAMQDPNATRDDRFDDIGSLQIMSLGLPGSPGNVIGQIWITYDMEFCKPIISPEAQVEPTTAIVAFTSNPDGTTVSGSASGPIRSEYSVASFNPVATTTYTVAPPNGWVYVSGLPLTNAVMGGRTASYLSLYERGVYTFVYTLTADTTASLYLLNGVTGTAYPSTNDAKLVTDVGDDASIVQYGNVPSSMNTGVATGGYKAAVTVVVTVTECGAAGITYYPPKFTTHGTGLVQGLVQKVYVTWVASKATIGVPVSS